MPSTSHVGGLGMRKHFDPRNLDYLIGDAVGSTRETKQLAVAVSRRHLVAGSGTPKVDVVAMAEAATTAGQTKYFYDSAWWGDQGNTPHCTAFAAMHLMADGPVTHAGMNPIMEPHAFFQEIAAIDVSEGRDYGGDGATSLAMAKAMMKRGWIGSYYWGYTITDFINAMTAAPPNAGPILLGIDWYSGMDSWEPKTGIIRAKGYIRGGHEIEANGINLDSGLARVKQSWGRNNYGINGHAYIPLEDLEMLISTGGDVCMVREIKKIAA